MDRQRKKRTKSTVFLSPSHRGIISNSGKTVQKFFEDLIDFCSEHDMFSWEDGQFFFHRARVVMVRSDFLSDLCDALPEPYDIGRKLGDKTRHIYAAVWNLDPSKPDYRVLFHLRDTTRCVTWRDIRRGNIFFRLGLDDRLFTNDKLWLLRAYFANLLPDTDGKERDQSMPLFEEAVSKRNEGQRLSWRLFPCMVQIL